MMTMMTPGPLPAPGEVLLRAICDGRFLARPSYFGEAVESNRRPDVFDRDGAAWLPIGCYLIRTSDRVVLIDVGLGPQRQQLPDGMELSGGDLLTGWPRRVPRAPRSPMSFVHTCTPITSGGSSTATPSLSSPMRRSGLAPLMVSTSSTVPRDGSTHPSGIPSPRQLVATSADEPRHGSGAGRYHGCHPWAHARALVC